MARIWETMSEFYHDILENKSDPRTKDWPLMGSPLPTLTMCILYVITVKIIGPKLMENRKPYNLRRVMIVFNSLQICFSMWIFYRGLKYGWWNDYSFQCQPVDFSYNPKSIGMAESCWWFFISKFVDFFDTILFVLRKKNSNISTLHVLHHGMLPFSVWTFTKFSPGGHSTLFPLLNAFVHIIMHGYYLLAAFGPKIQPYLGWKKYLTSLQMIQFIIAMVHTSQLFFIDCDYPKFFVFFTNFHAILFLLLFRNFYVQNYKKTYVKKL